MKNPVLSYNEAFSAIISTIEDGFVPLLIGPPGVGKTAMHALLAKELGLFPVSMIAREYEPHEISGVMDVRDGKLARHIVGPARIMAERPCLAMFDELTACPTPVFANMARVLHERCFGDVPVHPKTVFMAAANPQSQSLDANDMPLPLINRLRIFHILPTLAEIQTYFSSLGDPNSRLRAVGVELASIMDAKPELLELEPKEPERIQGENQNWGSPRSWERVARTLARETPVKGKILKAMLYGDLGPAAAESYLAIREIYGKLPSVEEITRAPETAALPKDFVEGVGVLGLLGGLAQKDPCAAWVYCNRIDEKAFNGGRETRIALTSALTRVALINKDTKSPFLEQAKRARVAMSTTNQKAKGAV